MKVRDLPGWPPQWIGGPGLAPTGANGTLRFVEWRVDLRGAKDLRITMEYRGGLWHGLYPGAHRVELEKAGGPHVLEKLVTMLGRYAGEPMARIGELDVS
jgi:hypothetical protein